MIKHFQKNEEGFTLIELMIVIAIIGILSAIAIPNFLQYRKAGYDAQALADAKNFYTACSANSTGQIDRAYGPVGGMPPGFVPNTTASGGEFTYTAATGAITCSTVFSHPQGKKTYTLDSAGDITEADIP